METLLLLNKNTFTILAERKLQNFKFITPPLSNENPYSEIIELFNSKNL